MKKIIIAIAVALTVVSCGVGTYSVTSGKPDEGAISFTARQNERIVVMVDNAKYEIQAVKTKEYKSAPNIKRTANNTITVPAGQHMVRVMADDGSEIYSKQLIIQQSEHRIVDLHR